MVVSAFRRLAPCPRWFFELFMAGYEDINQVSVEDVENLDGVIRV